jgi:hypothetical protein
LKEIFGESSEGSEGSRKEVGTLGETNKVGRIGVTSKAGGSVETSEGVTRESELIMPKVTGLHYEVEGILQDHTTPQIKELCSVGEGPNPKLLTPPIPYL